MSTSLIPGGGPRHPEFTETAPTQRAATRESAEGVKDSGVIERAVADLLTALLDVPSHLLLGVCTTLAQIARGVVGPGSPLAKTAGSCLDDTLSIFSQLMLSAQATETPGFRNLLAGQLADLLGIEVNAEQLGAALKRGGTLEFMRTLGEKLFSTLESEFAPDKNLSISQGKFAAQRFLGFVMSFAIREGNMAFFSEAATKVLEPLGFKPFENYRDYGAEMAQNLGLGRMTRLALRPLFQMLVSTPLEWQLNAQYRPRRLGKDELLSFYTRGIISKERLSLELAVLGYPNEIIEQLPRAEVPLPSANDYFNAEMSRIYSLGEVTEILKARGWTEGEIGTGRALHLSSRLIARWSEVVNALESQRVKNIITDQEFADALDKVPLSEPEKEVERKIVVEKERAATRRASLGQARNAWDLGIIGRQRFMRYLAEEGYAGDWAEVIADMPSAELTLGQMEQAYEDGIVDLTEWRTFLKEKGYNDQAQTVLTYQLLTNFERKKLKARAKGFTLSELRKLLKAGEITLEEFQKTLRDLGYGDRAVELISAEFIPGGP